METNVIEAALNAGIITEAQALAMRSLAVNAAAGGAEEPAPLSAPDDENLKFVGGFGDIFVTIGLGLFLGASAYFGSLAGGQYGAYFAAATLAWALAEYFTRKRRMALPSIVLLLVFVAGCLGFFASIFLSNNGATYDASLFQGPERWHNLGATVLACALTSALAIGYYWRFRVPIAVAGGVAALCGIVLASLFAAVPEFAQNHVNSFIILCGLCVFLLAMRFDISDPARLTRRADIAFWLHLLAAPMLVHPLLGPIMAGGAPTTLQAALIIAVFLILGLVAVIIDRRAVLASSLSYAGIAFGKLAKTSGITSETTPLTLLVLGAFILLITAGWHPLRRWLLGQSPSLLMKYLHNPDNLTATLRQLKDIR